MAIAMKRKLRKKKRRGGLAPDKYLSQDEERLLRRYVKDRADLARSRGSTRDIINEMIVTVLLRSGLRAIELCDLRLKDLPTHHGKDVIHIRDGKGAVARAVYIPNTLSMKLKQFIKRYRKNAKPSSPLIVNEQCGPLSYRSLYSKIKIIGRLAGIPYLHPHMLRHTYLSRLYAVDKDLRFVQDQAGHADPRTTAIYAKTEESERIRQVELLSD